MRKWIDLETVLLILTFLICFLLAAISSGEERSATTDLRVYHTTLLDLDRRVSEMDDTHQWIRNTCKAHGLTPLKQPVRRDGDDCWNDICIIEGDPERRIIVGACLVAPDKPDRVESGNPKDNAPACAVALMAAERLSEEKLKSTVEVHFYSDGGAVPAARSPVGKIEQYKFMVSLGRVNGHRPFPFNEIIKPLYNKHKCAAKVTWYRTATESGIHEHWQKKEVPVVILHVDEENMAEVVEYVIDIVRRVDKHISIKDSPYVFH